MGWLSESLDIPAFSGLSNSISSRYMLATEDESRTGTMAFPYVDCECKNQKSVSVMYIVALITATNFAVISEVKATLRNRKTF